MNKQKLMDLFDADMMTVPECDRPNITRCKLTGERYLYGYTNDLFRIWEMGYRRPPQAMSEVVEVKLTDSPWPVLDGPLAGQEYGCAHHTFVLVDGLSEVTYRRYFLEHRYRCVWAVDIHSEEAKRALAKLNKEKKPC